MRIKKMVVGDMDVNCYIIIDEESNKCAVVDVGAEPEKVIDFIEKENLVPQSIILTHGHYDHIGGCINVRDKFNLPVIAGEGEDKILTSQKNNLSILFGDNTALKADKYLKDGEEYSIGDIKFRTISTPGHTPGGISLYFENERVLISGDTLFFGSVGRTDFYLSDTDALLKSLSKLAELPDDIVVYPGHGPQTSIKFEKQNNPYITLN